MKITIENNGTVEVYDNVTDMALVYCQFTPVGGERTDLRLLPLAKSRSIFGHYPRELCKEVSAMASDLWDRLKELQNASASRSDRSVALDRRVDPKRLDARN